MQLSPSRLDFFPVDGTFAAADGEVNDNEDREATGPSRLQRELSRVLLWM
jgi:hypothetical protein